MIDFYGVLKTGKTWKSVSSIIVDNGNAVAELFANRKGKVKDD
jgi:hypothetical protein